MKRYLIVCAIFLLVLTGCAKQKEEEKDYTNEFIGHWHGEIRHSDGPVAIYVYLTPTGGQITVPSEAIEEADFTTVTYEEEKATGVLHLGERMLQIEGSLTGDRIEGSYKDTEKTYDFTLTRGEGDS
ncbi:hypothetical protein GCM10007425_20170 [Lysinibacillus alkalisoli]|uniref:Lipoprotein n=1 Tax=Lysinibacillus alkalisoli TaxID=1911548 RepID=A0A917G7D4_9BACI|nr:hypothetical protein [Lysinibacillus alkalisoli]GGG25528.1 hypothetical protein GCM10007425_20170 [Lysinibacillus alkalisoli]